MTSPVLHTARTERLLLRPWSEDDVDLVRASLDRSAEHLRPWIPFMRGEPRSRTETSAWLQRRRSWFDEGLHRCFALFDAEGGRLLGELTLLGRPAPRELEIGYWLDVRETGRGYALEGSAILTRIAFEHLDAELVEIDLATPNAASRVIPERLGFTHECTRPRRYVDCEGARHDLEVFVLFREDFADSPAARRAYEAFDAAGRPLAALG